MQIKISTEEKKEGYSQYELEECVRVLEKAKDIRADAEKMEAVKEFIEKKVKKISSLADLKDIAREKRLKAAGYEPEDVGFPGDEESLAKGDKGAPY